MVDTLSRESAGAGDGSSPTSGGSRKRQTPPARKRTGKTGRGDIPAATRLRLCQQFAADLLATAEGKDGGIMVYIPNAVICQQCGLWREQTTDCPRCGEKGSYARR